MGRRRAIVDRPLLPRDNSLNLVRLVLASLVIVSHSFTIGGFGAEPTVAGRHLGTWAVIAFFCLSGYLIMGSRERYRLGEYLMHRVARIYPAFVVSALLVVGVLAPVAYLMDHGTLSGYLTTHSTTPLSYLWGNAFLEMKVYDVSGTLADVPYPSVWNGSLWSLHYEFLCYLILAATGTWAAFSRSRRNIGLLFLLSVVLHANITTVSSYVTQGDIPLLMSLVPFFLGGAALYRYRTVLRPSGVGAALAAAASVTVIWLVPSWGPQLVAPAILYTLLWLGAALPSPRAVKKHDVSYGMYIYAFPLQQSLALLGAEALGAPAFILLSIAATIPLAVASWFIVERPAVLRARRPSRTVSPASPTIAEPPAIVVRPLAAQVASA